MHRSLAGRLVLTAALLITMAAFPSAALASTASDEAQGAAILRFVQQGERSCNQLSDSDFELAGEAWMGQTLGSTQAHDAMNRLMASMMGSSGEEQMHQYMGRRASGCGGGTVPSGFGRMMGAMGLMGGPPGAGAPGYGGAGMMGGQGGGYYGPGSMMGGGSSANDDDNDVSGWAVVAMIAITALFLAAVYFVVRGLRGRHAGPTPAEILRRRLASGEISQQDYERRIDLLGGGK